MAKSIDILFGVRGGGSISGESGRLILGQLQSIASQFSHDPQKRNVLTFGLNKTATKNQIEHQLDSIIKEIQTKYKTTGLNLDLTINGKKWEGTGGGNGGGGGGSRGSVHYNAATMIRDLDRQISEWTASGRISTQSQAAKYTALRADLSKEGADLAALNQRWKDLNTEVNVYNSIQKNAEKYTKQQAKEAEAALKQQTRAQEENRKAQEKVDAVNAKEQARRDAALEREMQSRAELQSQIEAQMSRNVNTNSGELRVTQELQDAYADLGQRLKDGTISAKEAGEEFERLKQSQRNVGASTTDLVRTTRLYEDASQYMKKFGETLQKTDPAKYQQLSDIVNELEQGKNTGIGPERLKQLTAELARLKAEADTALTPMQRLWNMFKSRVTSIALTTAVMLLRRNIRELYNNVVELDSAVTDLQIASGKSRNEVKAMVRDYSQLAKELGTTTVAVAQGADTWLRQGFSAAEANELLADSTKLAVLGQMDNKEAATALTSAMKGYKVEVNDAIGIVDKFTAVDMKAAASAGDIATAMSETAVGADLAGVSMDKLIGYLTVVKEVTQDGAESVGKELPSDIVIYRRKETISVKARRRVRPRKVA